MSLISKIFIGLTMLVPGLAFAEEAEAVAGNPLGSLIPLFAFVAIFYFMMWRPQSKRDKEHRALMGSVAIGDEVLTSSGLVGQIKALHEHYISLVVADGVIIKMQRAAISKMLLKGTIDNLDK